MISINGKGKRLYSTIQQDSPANPQKYPLISLVSPDGCTPCAITLSSPRSIRSIASPKVEINTFGDDDEFTEKPISHWYFVGSKLHCTNAHRLVQVSAIENAKQEGDNPVLFIFRDGRQLSLPRALLSVAGGSMSALAARNEMVSTRSVTLYDEDFSSFASIARYFACMPIDLCHVHAPFVATSAFRWNVGRLFYACFAAAELLPLGRSSLPEWLPNLIDWLALLDSNKPSLAIPLPRRFLTLLKRRVALLFSRLVQLSNGCATCDTQPYLRRNLSSHCMLCTHFREGRSIWQVLYTSRILSGAIYVAIRVGGPSVATHLLQIVSHSLRDTISEADAVHLLEIPKWDTGWAHIVQNQCTIAAVDKQEPMRTEDGRFIRIATQLVANVALSNTWAGSLLGVACVCIDKVANITQRTSYSVRNTGETWADWRVSLAVVRHFDVDSPKSGAVSDGLSACIYVEDLSAKERGVHLNSGRESDYVRHDGSVFVKVDAYSAGCACEMGCSMKRDSRIGKQLLGDRRWITVVKMSEITQHGAVLNLLNPLELTCWVERHYAQCSLIISAEVRIAGSYGIDRVPLKCKTVPSEFDYDEDELVCEPEDNERVCSCKQCRRSEAEAP